MTKNFNIAPNRGEAHPFDLQYGTDTGGYLAPETLGGGRGGDTTNNGYSAVAPSVFREACRRWRDTLPSSASRPDAYTFVDVGAGKGRALLLAAELPFRKVIGVEIEEELATIAQSNVEAWRRAGRLRARAAIRVQRQDAMEFAWPRSPLLVFLNNPFDCALVERLAARLAATPGRRVADLLYVNPGCADALTREGLFELLWDVPIEMSEADRAADPYGAAADRVCAFRLCRRGS